MGLGGSRFKVQGSGFRVQGCGAAHKNQKRRRILIEFNAVVIPTEVEGSLLQAGDRRIFGNGKREVFENVGRGHKLR